MPFDLSRMKGFEKPFQHEINFCHSRFGQNALTYKKMIAKLSMTEYIKYEKQNK